MRLAGRNKSHSCPFLGIPILWKSIPFYITDTLHLRCSNLSINYVISEGSTNNAALFTVKSPSFFAHPLTRYDPYAMKLSLTHNSGY